MVSYGNHMTEIYHQERVAANGIHVHVASIGDGPPLLLLHGWPHTWFVWHRLAPLLARDHRVIMPDLRGLGASARAEAGYDLHTLADDAAGVLDACGAGEAAAVIAMDLGVSVAWMVAARHRDRVRALVLMEGLVGRLPGAERFLANGPPWWWGFHTAAAALAETALAGNEAAYVGWFLRGLPEATRAVFVDAYRDNLGLAHYRAMAANAAVIAATPPPADVPTLAIAGGVVGDALAGQLAPLARSLATARIADCGHVIPLEQPERLAACIAPFVAAPRT